LKITRDSLFLFVIFMQSEILAEVVRGETVESVHRGHLVVLDGEGETIAAVGNPEIVTFWRSSGKPFQAISGFNERRGGTIRIFRKRNRAGLRLAFGRGNSRRIAAECSKKSD
jgi:L-asparaginase II